MSDALSHLPKPRNDYSQPSALQSLGARDRSESPGTGFEGPEVHRIEQCQVNDLNKAMTCSFSFIPKRVRRVESSKRIR